MPKLLNVRAAIKLEEADQAKRERIRIALQRQGLPTLDAVLDSYIYRVGLDAADPERQTTQQT